MAFSQYWNFKKATKEDTNPNAVLKQITANYIKMDPAALPKAKKIVELVSINVVLQIVLLL